MGSNKILINDFDQANKRYVEKNKVAKLTALLAEIKKVQPPDVILEELRKFKAGRRSNKTKRREARKEGLQLAARRQCGKGSSSTSSVLPLVSASKACSLDVSAADVSAAAGFVCARMCAHFGAAPGSPFDGIELARPAPFASRSVQRPLLTPQGNPGSLYHCGRGT